VHCHIAYGQLAVNLPAGHLGSAIPVLIDILRDVPHVEFDPSLNWTGVSSCRCTNAEGSQSYPPDWALPDQLVYSTVTALLRLASRDGTPREHIIESIISFICDAVSLIKGTRGVSPAFCSE
jgi:phosphatidylinositol 4-kinase A